MARPVRIEFAGAIYHVSSRMIGSWRDRRERLFADNRDYQRFLQRLEQNVSACRTSSNSASSPPAQTG